MRYTEFREFQEMTVDSFSKNGGKGWKCGTKVKVTVYGDEQKVSTGSDAMKGCRASKMEQVMSQQLWRHIAMETMFSRSKT